jgi:hypothetical protein
MKPNQIETWALRVIKQAQSRQPSEDKQTELKGVWPVDHNKAARRIAGHANAAGGEPILWLVGVDEQTGAVLGAQHQEFSNWMSGIRSQFDGSFAPRCHDLNVVTDQGLTVVALVFESDRSPYVVKNPHYQTPNRQDPIEREVPWRDATSVRTATRADLLLILSEKRSLQALLGELEWNEAVAGRDGYGLERFRTKEFHKVLNNGALGAASNDLKALVTDAYLLIENAQGYKRILEITSDGANRGRIQKEMSKAKEKARLRVVEALGELREFLGRQ